MSTVSSIFSCISSQHHQSCVHSTPLSFPSMSSLSQMNATPFIHPLPKPETTGLSWTPFFLSYPTFSPLGTPSSAFRRSPNSSHFSHAPDHHHLSPDSCRIPYQVSLLLFLPPFISNSRQGDPIKSQMSPSRPLLKSLGRLLSPPRVNTWAFACSPQVL